MDLFDVIGPVMIGPSSSHTAGAARIGKIARLLLGGEPVEASIGLWGSFQKTYRGHGTDRALVGGLLGMDVDDTRLRDSLTQAQAVGLRVSFHNAKLRYAHPNTVVLSLKNDTGRTLSLQAASVGGGEIIIQSVDGLETAITGHANTLVLTYRDAPGMIAVISGQVAAFHLNIATMRVSRDAVGGGSAGDARAGRHGRRNASGKAFGPPGCVSRSLSGDAGRHSLPGKLRGGSSECKPLRKY